MKESDYKEGLAKYLVKRDQFLALNIDQARQLVQYIRKFEDRAGMLPPFVDTFYVKDGEILAKGVVGQKWEE